MPCSVGEAVAAGKSLKEYLLGRVIEEANHPTLLDVLERADERAGGSVSFKAAVKTIRDDLARR
jgi:hypothetical protein